MVGLHRPIQIQRPWHQLLGAQTWIAVMLNDLPWKRTKIIFHFCKCTQVLIVFIPIPKKDNDKECSNYHTIALISHASKVMLKILQARLQQYINCELTNIQAQFSKGRRTRDQIANICWIIEKAREFQKTSIFALLTMPKLRLCGSQ